jgi:hypothetical protein
VGKRITKKDRLARIETMTARDRDNWQKYKLRHGCSWADAIDAAIIRERKSLGAA